MKSEDSLIEAITNNNFKKVKELIEEGTDIHAYYDWPIRLASFCGYAEIAEYLINKGANIYEYKDFALRYASGRSHTKVVKLLFSSYKDKDAALKIIKNWGYNKIDIRELK